MWEKDISGRLRTSELSRTAETPSMSSSICTSSTLWFRQANICSLASSWSLVKPWFLGLSLKQYSLLMALQAAVTVSTDRTNRSLMRDGAKLSRCISFLFGN